MHSIEYSPVSYSQAVSGCQFKSSHKIRVWNCYRISTTRQYS
nr:MAG TPA: hypothetical protein [Caudoviricetes sp.]